MTSCFTIMPVQGQYRWMMSDVEEPFPQGHRVREVFRPSRVLWLWLYDGMA